MTENDEETLDESVIDTEEGIVTIEPMDGVDLDNNDNNQNEE